LRGESWVEESWIIGLCECWEACESLGADWFGKPSNTLEPSLWIHSPGSGVTLLLRFGTIVSIVGWNVLGLQLAGVIFHKDKCSLLWHHLHAYECISVVYLIIV
jgi:hypothetical protein